MLDYQQYVGLKVTQARNCVEENLELLDRNGFFVVESVLNEKELELVRFKMDVIWEKQKEKYGTDFLNKIGDYGQIRAMMLDDPFFYDLLIHPKILKYVALAVGETAILHLQNGIVLHPDYKNNQAKYHKDFPKDFISSKILSFNAFVIVDEFNESTGGTWVVPGSHKFVEMPSEKYIEKNCIQIEARAGSIIFFDSMLWHKGGDNYSAHVRRAINQQYTRPFIKQQLDYPAMLKDKVDKESKLAQVLGFWSISPKSVDEYRVNDPSLRTYRASQG
ncbi:MAG: phytanoyl-CoA dioxygenase family protein [Candidatus Melainabacteria bacterium]|nr:phytanoyl-CoA dioxygenase family protein [Candidatus Melainabacteria bacterium]